MDLQNQETPVRYWKEAVIFRLWKAVERMIVEDAESRTDPLQEAAFRIKVDRMESQKDAGLCDLRLKVSCVCEWLKLPCDCSIGAINEAMKALICDKGAADRSQKEMPILYRIFGIEMSSGYQALLYRVQSFVEKARKAGVS